MKSQKARRAIASFSLGYLLGLVTIHWASQYSDTEYVFYPAARDVVGRSERDCTRAAVDQMDKYSYLLVLYYFEQMSNAMSHLLHLGPVAMNLDLRIVEPFVVHSRLYGLPGMLPPGEVTGPFYSLRTLFNIESINQSLYTYSNASLASFKEFIIHAPRDVVVVYFIHKEGPRPRTFRLAYRYLRILKLVTEAESSVIDCTDEIFYEEQIYGGLLGSLLNITVKYGVNNFRIIKFICVSAERVATTDQLREYIGPEKKTVVFPEWRGCAYKHCNLKMRHEFVTHIRPKLLYRLQGEKASPPTLPYIKSDHVMETVELFSKSLSLTKKPYISVYMRIEKLLKTNSTFHIDEKYIKCCTTMLQKVLAGVKRRYKLSNVLLITDLGKYGSDACPGNCQLAGADILKDVERMNKIKVFNYDPDKMPLRIDNSGFAAMVEMELLAGARRLITVGLGRFKEQLIQLYGKKKPHSNVYNICMEQKMNVLHDFVNLPSHC